MQFLFLLQKNFKDWQSHEICMWFLTLSLNEDYSKRIMQYKISGAGLMAIIEAHELLTVGFADVVDNIAIKNAVKKQLS